MGITSTQQNKKEGKMKKTALFLVVFALLVGCASTGQSPRPSPKVGDYAPDFSITDVSGDKVRLSDFKGQKNVVLVFYSDST
jgi:peroxiredoxin Q/BCP